MYNCVSSEIIRNSDFALLGFMGLDIKCALQEVQLLINEHARKINNVLE